MHPQFPELVDIALALKKKYLPQARLGVLSNSTTLNDPGVRQALAKLDYRFMKLDAGEIKTFNRINLPDKSVNFAEIIRGLKLLDSVIIQAMFLNGYNTVDEQVEAWIECLREIKPLRAQVYSLDRPPADPSLQPASNDTLRSIGARVEKSLRIPADVIISKT